MGVFPVKMILVEIQLRQAAGFRAAQFCAKFRPRPENSPSRGLQMQIEPDHSAIEKSSYHVKSPCTRKHNEGQVTQKPIKTQWVNDLNRCLPGSCSSLGHRVFLPGLTHCTTLVGKWGGWVRGRRGVSFVFSSPFIVWLRVYGHYLRLTHLPLIHLWFNRFPSCRSLIGVNA